MRKWFVAVVTTLVVTIGVQSAALADPPDLPPNWHIHDGNLAAGPQHKPIGFFPTILGLSTTDYLKDPAVCPNATDKAFLPSADTRQSDVDRAGVCRTSTTVIHLRTVAVGTSGPDDWQSLMTPSQPGFITYYKLTPI
jgi:hypothetical protein